MTGGTFIQSGVGGACLLILMTTTGFLYRENNGEFLIKIKCTSASPYICIHHSLTVVLEFVQLSDNGLLCCVLACFLLQLYLQSEAVVLMHGDALG